MIKHIEKHPILSLFLFVIVMLGFTIDAIPVSIMEARNFISAREMLTDNHWILTTMNGEARYEKPPLPTWITAAFGFIFGIKSVLALRWPTLLFLASIGIFTYRISKTLNLSKSHSTINGFIVLTSFYVIGITIEAPWDIYTHGFMLIAIFQLLQLMQCKRFPLLQSFLFVTCIAGSVLSKGPVSLYVLFLPFIVAYGSVYGFKNTRLHYVKLSGLLGLGILLGGSWYFYVRINDPETFTKIALKETSNWSHYNVRPFYYYWSFFVQSGLWSIPAFISLLYPYLKSKVSNLKAYRFSLFWTLTAVILLSVIPEKKSRYVMPVLIPLAITIGFYIHYLIRAFKTLKSKKETIPVYFQFGVIALLASAFFIAAYSLLYKNLNEWSLVRYIIASFVLLSIGILIFKQLKLKKIKPVVYLSALVMLSFGVLVVPLTTHKIASNYKPISKLSSSTTTLYSYGYVAPEVIYNYGNKIPPVKTKNSYNFPNTNEFKLLSAKESPKEDKTLSKYYAITYLETYDLNVVDKGTRAYKTRLVNKLYLLKRK